MRTGAQDGLQTVSREAGGASGWNTDWYHECGSSSLSLTFWTPVTCVPQTLTENQSLEWMS